MIRVFEPKLNFKDYISVLKTLHQNNISGTSPIVKKFEKHLAQAFEMDEAVSLSNGSVALEMAFRSLDLKEGDEVIVPSFTIISCLSAIIRTGATPIFCDVDQISWNMTLDNVTNKYSKKTKAILMVHTYGLAAEAEKIRNFCDSNNLILIEDTAEAHGQVVNGKKCGSFGDISTLSFYANKHITTGEGGAVLSNNRDYIARLRQLINLDFRSEERFKHQNFYWNQRLGGLQAALGISQIEGLTKVINQKIIQAKAYNNIFKEHEEKVMFHPAEHNGVKNHYWVYGILLKKDNIRDQLMKNLLDIGIETRPFFWPLHKQDAFLNKNPQYAEKLPIAENLGKNGLYIPIGNHIQKKDQIFIANKLIEFIS